MGDIDATGWLRRNKSANPPFRVGEFFALLNAKSFAEVGDFDVQSWFLSYNSQDLALMQGLEASLRRRDAASKIFFAPKSLRAGGFWLPELAKEIAEASAFVLLVGEKGLGPWQVIEYYEALDRRVKQADFPVILVLLDGQPAPGLPFLRQLHWIITADPASEQSVGRIMDAAAGGGALPGELWRHTAPYRGLAAMTEADSDFFFGRGRETVEVIRALEAAPDKLPVLLGNSGVGKSSLAQAGALGALKRQAWPEQTGIKDWPVAFKNSRQWCYLSLKPGTDPIKALVDSFLNTWQFEREYERTDERNGWIERLGAEPKPRVTLSDLLDATERRRKPDRPKSLPFLLYIDQGEELYVRAEERQRRRFSEILAQALPDPRLRALMSMRADFFGELLNDAPLQDVSRKIEVPPLREAQLNEVVSKPATLLGARFENDHLATDIARRAAEESSRDAGALPLLSYLLDDMWKSKDPNWDGTLRLPAPAIELGRVLVDRANAFIAEHPGAEHSLRRIFTLKLATVREDGEPTRRRALRHEFSGEEWRLVSELADHPNRLLVTATTEAGDTYAEVAHEAIFKRWDKLREWIAGQREFLAWRSGLEASRRAWQTTAKTDPAMPPRDDALLMGAALSQAQEWLAKRAEDLPAPDRDFIAQSIARESKVQARARRVRTTIYGLGAVVILGLIGVIYQAYITAEWRYATVTLPYWYTHVRGHVRTAAQERVLKPGESFRECPPRQKGKDYCPTMVVVPAGSFMMEFLPGEKKRPPYSTEIRQHTVTFAKSFAVSKYEVTFAEWDTCVTYGDCAKVNDSTWGRGERPVINVNWDDAQTYVAWLSEVTGKRYRLLTDAEYQYAARGCAACGEKKKKNETIYPWGNDIKLNGKVMANCKGCGRIWDGHKTAPVGSFTAKGFVGTFPANAFGLHDMVGNVWEWTEDCWHKTYKGAPKDGSAWLKADGGICAGRVVRGGAWDADPMELRLAYRYRIGIPFRDDVLGFRVARTLAAGAGAITVAPGVR